MARSLSGPVRSAPAPRGGADAARAGRSPSTVGCGHHKRSSLRPVYTTPCRRRRVALPVGRLRRLGRPVRPSSTSSSVDPAVIESGASGSGTAAAGAPDRLEPVGLARRRRPAPSRSIDTPPPVTGPTMPGFSDEPGLTPVPPENSSKVPAPKRRARAPAPARPSPSASLKSGSANGGRRNAPGRLRSASLRDDLTRSPTTPTTCSRPPKADRPWKYIVLHHSASADRQLRLDRPRAPQAARLAGLRLPLRDRQRHREPRRPDRGRPALGRTRSTASTAATARTPTSTSTGSASASSATSTTPPRPTARSPPPGPSSPTSATATRSPPTTPRPTPTSPPRPPPAPASIFPAQAILGSNRPAPCVETGRI